MTGITATKRVTIASGGTTSEAVDTRMHSLTGVEMPAAFDGTALTFEAASTPGGTFKTVEDDAGAAVSFVVAASMVVAPASADRDALYGKPFLRVVSNASESAARVIVLYLTSN